MKKISMLAVMVLIVSLMLAAVAFAGELTESIKNGTAATLVVASAQELFSVTAIGEATENTSAARAWHFYNNVSVMVSDSPGINYLFSITKTVGTYFNGELFRGSVYAKWAQSYFDGVTFSNGIVVSPTAGTKISAIFQYK